MPKVVDLMSPAEFAELVGADRRRVSEWIALGMPHRLVDNQRRISPRDALRWVRAHERELGRGEVAPDEAVERAKKLRYEARLKELDVLERERRLIPADELEQFLEHFVGGFASAAANRLRRFERQVIAATTPAAARKLTTEMHAELMRGANEYGQELQAMAAAEQAEGDE